ncbi:MAG: hypothetical protein MUC76_08880 [Spirochaetes bacterium]|jgi:transposase|nr:hypothetical protein [Spirochaetota bacterium]
MKPDLSKEELKLFSSKTPDDFIDRSLKVDIPRGRKAFIARLWLEKTGYESSDIEYARNRHPYWKARKGEGGAERVLQRLHEHDYSTGESVEWTEKRIQKFIELNAKDKNGKYITRDWELAKRFKCSIATIQHMRRKYNMTTKIIIAGKGKVTAKKLLEYLQMGEGMLREMTRAL